MGSTNGSSRPLTIAIIDTPDTSPVVAAFACVIAAVLLAIGVAVINPSIAEATETDTETERHCVIEVLGTVDGVFITGPETCFATLAEVDRHLEVSTPSSGPITSKSGMQFQQSSTGSTTIGRHFTGLGYSGSSVTISGTTCGGGVWYATGSWNNNLESSYHYCGSRATTFYSSSSCGGADYPINGSRETLRSMNNSASCVRYG